MKATEAKLLSFIQKSRQFHKPQQLYTLNENNADILAIEKEAEGLLDELLKG